MMMRVPGSLTASLLAIITAIPIAVPQLVSASLSPGAFGPRAPFLSPSSFSRARSVRGGDHNSPPTDPNDVIFADLGSAAAAVLDLRPDAARSSAMVFRGTPSSSDDEETVVILGREGVGRHASGRAVALVPDSIPAGGGGNGGPSPCLLGIFSGDGDGADADDGGGDEAKLRSLAAAAEALGALCGSVVLLVTCGADGRTSLHRSAGLMLAGLVNGLRRRAGEGGGGCAALRTKLTLLLFPSDSRGPVEDLGGANFLVKRLRDFFSMGTAFGESSEGGNQGEFDPFMSVDISLVPSETGASSDAIKTAVLCSSGNKFLEERDVLSRDAKINLMASAYKSMGGEGSIEYHDVHVS